MKKIIGFLILIVFLPCQLPAMETPYVAVLALDATNSGTTTAGTGTSTFVIVSASKQIKIEKARDIYDTSKLKGWLRSDGYHSLYIMELTPSQADAALGNSSGVTCDIVVEYTPEDTDEAWLKAKSLTIFDDLALSGATKQPIRFYPVWGSDFYRFKITSNNGVTVYNKAKIRYEMK